MVSLLEILGLTLGICGLIVGLGATTVIDTLGFLGRKNTYWSSVTHRAHRVTKPLIWLGVTLYLVGLGVWYFERPIQQFSLLQFALAAVLVANGVYLSFVVSPMLLRREAEGKDKELIPSEWQWRITVNFLISFFCWWASVLLFVRMILSLVELGDSLFIV